MVRLGETGLRPEPFQIDPQSICRRDGLQRVENIMLLVKHGDASSLKKLRTILGKSPNEIASLIGVGAEDLEKWEKGEAQPTSLKHAHWKLKLTDFVDVEIARFLGTDNPEVVIPFWQLIWTLNSDFW